MCRGRQEKKKESVIACDTTMVSFLFRNRKSIFIRVLIVCLVIIFHANDVNYFHSSFLKMLL